MPSDIRSQGIRGNFAYPYAHPLEENLFEDSWTVRVVA